MAVLSTESFTADGTQKTFTVSNTILSSSHARIHFYYDDGLGGGATDHTVADGDWDLLGQSTIVFKEAPTSSYVVKITVSSDGSGLDAAPSEISDVTSNMAAILNVNSIDAEIVTVSGVSSDVTTVADDLAKGAGTNQPADSAILNALTNANQTIADAAATAADVLATNADATVTNNNVSLTNADVVSTHADVVLTNADAAQTNLDRIATSADRVQTGLDATATSNDRVAIETIYDNFDDRYLGQFASDPTLDNDGQALLVGAMYFNTTVDNTKFYNGASWEDPELTATQAASTATTQAGIATTKASEASDDATTASTAATTAATNLGLFEDQFQSDTTEPSSPILGMLWFDETNGLMKVYDGAGWVNAGSSVNGVEKSEEFIATGGQTVFTVSSGYDSGFVNVFREGMLLGESEYTADNGSTVTLNVACTAGDIVKVQSFGAFTLADHYTKVESDVIDSAQDAEIALKAAKAQTINTSTVYTDNTTGLNYKMYVDNGQIILEELA